MLSAIRQPLAATLRKKYWKNGFLLMPNYFTKYESKQIEDWADELGEWKEEIGKWMVYYESSTDTKRQRARIENFVKYNKELKCFVENRITCNLNDILQEELVLYKDKMNWKKPFGKGFNAHQDHPAWNDFPPKRFVSAAMFGNQTTKENGCLEFSKGNHMDGVLSYEKDNGGDITQDVEEQLQWEYVETTPRDLLIFDSFSPHRSKANSTDKQRRVFYFTYNNISEGDYHQQYIDRKRREFPPEIERESGKIYNKLSSKYNLANPMD